MALATGNPDVDAMLDAISSRQWSEWRAFWQEYGWGERRMDARFAQLAALLINMVSGKDGQGVSVEDLLPDEGGEDDGDEYDEGIEADVSGDLAALDEDQVIFEALLAEAMG